MILEHRGAEEAKSLYSKADVNVHYTLQYLVPIRTQVYRTQQRLRAASKKIYSSTWYRRYQVS